jgi:hypothetical protein
VAVLVGVMVAAMASWHLLMVEFFVVTLVFYLLVRSLAIWLSGARWRSDLDVRRLLGILVAMAVVAVPASVFRILYGNLASFSGPEKWLTISPYPTFRSSLDLGHGFSIIGPLKLYIVDVRWRFAPYRFAVWLFSYVAALFMIPSCLKRQRCTLFMVGTVSIVPLVLLNPFLITFLQGKMVDVGIIRLVLLQPYGLILAWFFSDQVGRWLQGVSSVPNWREWPRRWVRLVGLIGGGTLLALMAYVLARQGIDNLRDLYDPNSRHVYSLAASHAQMRRSDQPPYTFLLDRSTPDTVVLSDPENSYYLGALTGRSVVAVVEGHYPPATGPSHRERQSDSLTALDPASSMEETRRLLDKYGVCLIWVDGRSKHFDTTSPVRAKFESAPELFARVYESPEVAIYQYLGHRPGCLQ